MPDSNVTRTLMDERARDDLIGQAMARVGGKTGDDRLQELLRMRDEVVEQRPSTPLGIASDVIGAVSPLLAILNPVFALAGAGLAGGLRRADPELQKFNDKRRLNEQLIEGLISSGLTQDRTDSDVFLGALREQEAGKRQDKGIKGDVAVENIRSLNTIKEIQAQVQAQNILKQGATTAAELEDQTQQLAALVAQQVFREAIQAREEGDDSLFPQDPLLRRLHLGEVLGSILSQTEGQVSNSQEIIERANGILEEALSKTPKEPTVEENLYDIGTSLGRLIFGEDEATSLEKSLQEEKANAGGLQDVLKRKDKK